MKDHDILSFVEVECNRIDIDPPSITFRKMSRAFGFASYHDWNVTLNKSWVHRSGDIIVKMVILHELLHLKTYWIHGLKKCGHSKEFRSLCKEYGCELTKAQTSTRERKVLVAATRNKYK